MLIKRLSDLICIEVALSSYFLLSLSIAHFNV